MEWFKILRICILFLMLAPAVHATYEDFTTYTEVDPNSRITKNATQVDWTLVAQNEVAYVYKDFGVNYFDGDFTHAFDFETTGGSTGYFPIAYGLSNTLGDVYYITYTQNQDMVGVRQALGNSYIYLHKDKGGSDCGAQTTATTYYVKVQRIEAQNKLYAGIYSSSALRDAGNATNADVCNLEVALSASTDYRYLYTAQSYNNGDGFTMTGFMRNLNLDASIEPTIEFTNVSINGNSNFNNTYYNDSSVILSINLTATDTNNNTNSTIYIYNSTGLLTTNQFITNGMIGDYNITFPYEGDFYFWLYAVNNETNTTSPSTGNYTIHYDITPPTINNTLPSNISSYELGNLSSYVSCANIGSGLCVVYFSSDNVTYNSSDNVSFTFNGNQSYVITATDGGGNTATESGVLLVNPLQYFRFYDTLRALFVEDYSFGGYSSSGEYVSIPVYDLGLGNQSLQFSRFGYTQESFAFSFNTTSALNQTFNVSAITITVQVFDESSPSNQLTFNLSMNNVSNYTQYLNQLNFSKYYNETLHGNLTLTAESSGYSLRKIYTQLNPYTAVSHVIYLLADADSTPVIFRVLNLAQTQSIEDVVFTFKKEISGTPTFLGQAKTDSQGYTYFNMDVLGDYQITISKAGYVTQIINSIPGKSEYTILIEEEGSSTPFLFENFNYYFTPSSSNVSSVPFNVSAYTFDEANLISSMRFTVTGDNTSFTDVLTSSSGGIIQFTVTNASPQYLLNLTVMRDGQEYNFIKKLNYYQTAASNATVQKVAQELDGSANTENRVFMMIILYVVAVVLGSLFSPTVGAVAGLLPITIFAIPSVGWLTPGVAALFYLITILGVLYFER